MLSGPGPPPPHGFPPFPGPRPPARPWMENASASSQERRTASEQVQGHPFSRRKEQRHILYGHDDIIANKRQQPYHSSVEHTAPHRRGGANQNDHRPGGDKAKHDQTGKATRPNKTTTHS